MFISLNVCQLGLIFFTATTTSRSMVNSDIANWLNLQFSPTGLQQLRGLMGVPDNVVTRFDARFKAAELAWLATGLAHDNTHLDQTHGLHPLFHSSRQPFSSANDRRNLRQALLDILFDIVCFFVMLLIIVVC